MSGRTVLLLLLLLAVPAAAQETVSDDDVNAVAERLYCPVCENIPLDDCQTPACIQWRAEIRTQLEGGSTPEEVIDSFVRQFGDRVVGTPQDATLRALSLVTPWLLAAAAALVGLATLARWTRRRRPMTPGNPESPDFVAVDDDYRARLEQDLRARR